jgi:threonine/homoserine/homoserine lactone efflux protein
MSYLLTAFALGLQAGIAPGPIATLVISQTLKHNTKEGIKIALAPLYTDLPIVLVSLFVLSRMSNAKNLLGVLSIIGAVYLFWLAWISLRTKPVEIDLHNMPPRSIRKGAITNLLNPNPYLFWFGVGASNLLNAVEEGVLFAALFLIIFYALLVGGKVALALIVGRSRHFLAGAPYINIMRALGVALSIFGFLAFRDGLQLLGVLQL